MSSQARNNTAAALPDETFANHALLFRTLVEQTTDAIFLIELETEECIYVSPSVRTLLGHDPEQLIGRPLTDLAHPDDRGMVIARSELRRRGEDLPATLTRMAHSDGRWIWVQATASPVVRHEGRLACVFTAANATRLVVAETGLRTARQHLGRLLEVVELPGRALDDPRWGHQLTVEALAAALELRDDETGLHTRRVTDLALRLTDAVDSTLAVDPELRSGFLLHDIGKIGIPDSILLKPGPLSERETRTLQMHPTLGEHLLSFIPFVSDLAHDVVAYHHERWDGSGYPWGLSGDEIPLPARIFAVADAFDALTNARPYRTARPIGAAIDEIQQCAGTHFDPAIVDAFLPIARELQTTTPVDLG